MDRFVYKKGIQGHYYRQPAILSGKQRFGLLIYAFVIMSNHIHIVLQSTKGRLSAEVGELKSYTAKEILKIVQSKGESRREWMANLFEYAAKKHKRNEKYQVWTHENHAEIIYSSKFFEQKVNYIHDNPVRAGIVEYPEQYIYSSAPRSA